jgi:hypothetical protein
LLRTAFPKLLFSNTFWLRKITMDPPLAHVYIECPDDSCSKLKIHVSELILDSYEYIPVAYVTIHCIF